MPQINTTLTGHSQRSGSSARGPWTLNIFKAADGREFTTLDSSIGNQALGLLNQPALLTYEERPNKNPAYPPSLDIKAIVADPAAGSAVQAVKQGSPPPASVNTTPQTHDERQAQINRQSARRDAISYFAATGEPFTTDDVYRLAEEFVAYSVDGPKPAEVVPITAGAAPDNVGF